MFTLYIIQSASSKRKYIGITHDVQNRLREHNSGEVRSTKAYKPWIIAHVEQFSDKTSARKREIFLKKNAKARLELFENLAPSSSG